MANPYSKFGLSDEDYAWMKDVPGMTEEKIAEIVGSGNPNAATNQTINVTGPGGVGSETQIINGAGGTIDVPYGTDVNSFLAMTPEQRMQAQLLGMAKEQQVKNEGAVMWGAGDGLARQQDAVDASAASAEDRLRQYQQLQAGANQYDAAALQGVKNAGLTANQGDQALMDTMRGVYGGAFNADQAALAGLQGAGATADATQQRAAQTFGGYADEYNNADQALASQLASRAGSYGTLQSQVFGGIDSAAGAAQADPNAIAMQRAAGDRFLDIASGGADLQSSATGTQADQKAVGAQNTFLDQYLAGSDPSMSATERYMMENARRGEEQDRKAAMGAKLRDLQARGMLGSGEELAAMLGAQSTTSQNRQMQDLAALAAAQQRAERQQAQGTALAGSMRGSSFGEQMDVANARDQFSLANRDAALNALGQYAGLGGTMRGQSFGEASQAGTAQDSMSRFNQTNSIQQAQYNTELARQQQQAEWDRIAQATGVQMGANQTGFGRQGEVLDAVNDASNAQYDRAGNNFDAATSTTGAAYDRANDLANTGLGVNDAAYDRNTATADATAQLGQNAFNRGTTGIGMQETAANNAYGGAQDTNALQKSYVGLATDQGAGDTNTVMGAQKSGIADAANTKALESLEDDRDFMEKILDPGGLFK